jgi:hypothetical protein
VDHQRLHRSACTVYYWLPHTYYGRVRRCRCSPVLIRVLQFLVKSTALQLSGIHTSALDHLVIACPIVSSSTSQVIIKIFISHIILTFPPLRALNFSYSSHGVSSRTLGFSPKYLVFKNSKETIKSMLPKVTHAPASDLFQIIS